MATAQPGDATREGDGKAAESIESARAAGLRYVNDRAPGIRRRGASHRSFRYLDPQGRALRDPAVLSRVESLAIPPAWRDVWICAYDNGHIQATGRDARGRKQYRYHARWREVRDDAKYSRLVSFAGALPRIRQTVRRDLRLPGLPRRKVLATVVSLLEKTRMRVGNDEYARANGSFGLTTLKNRHAKVRGSRVQLRFRGKHGILHRIELDDRRLARIVARCQDLPGQRLLEYTDESGEVRDVDSADVNGYLKEVTGEDFTAKDFRTWAGTVLAAQALGEPGDFATPARTRKNVVAAVDRVALRLGNTRAVCLKCYVHPAVIGAYMDGSLGEALGARAERGPGRGGHALAPEEAAVLRLIRQRPSRGPDGPPRPPARRRRSGGPFGWASRPGASPAPGGAVRPV